jgi:hypothetical protein
LIEYSIESTRIVGMVNGKRPINLAKEQVIRQVSSKSTFEKMYQVSGVVSGLPNEEISREGEASLVRDFHTQHYPLKLGKDVVSSSLGV